ncbi:protein-disulfide reductase DsbD domain-containing protein [Ferrovibrio xuzhouensis]|uniref:Protein-disulfide reductase DsbD domain-containing protein n=1 Tax=Ferrovibrio xuzhouensis TaxID=1576914 RepID=A0ABV7VPJ2_9PROT
MKNRNMRRILAVLAVLLPLPAAAQVVTTLERSAPDPARLDIVDGGNGSIGLRVRLAPGWKFYWRTPGEGGVPPQFDWSGSQNLKAAQMAWPAPHRITIGDADLFGYVDEVILPVMIVPQKTGAAIDLALRAEYGVCKDICILREDHLQHRIAAQPVADPQAAALLADWRARVPQPAAAAGVKLVSRLEQNGRLSVILSSDRPLHQPDLLVEGTPDAWFGRPVVTLATDGRQAQFVLPVTPPAAAAGPLVLTLLDGGRAAELTLPKP